MNERQARSPKLGRLFVFAGASGSGKSTICKRLAREGLGLVSVSYTTREITARETHGIEYHFVSREEFENMIANGAMAEWASVHGHLYGTGLEWLHSHQQEGHNVLLDIDVQGMLQLREKISPCHSIFILPSNFEVLEQRLRERERETGQQIKVRLQTAKSELRQIDQFDYLLVNDDLDLTCMRARIIIQANNGDASSSPEADGCLASNQPGLLDKWSQFTDSGI